MRSDAVVSFLFPVLFIAAVLGNIQMAALTRRLKQDHPETFRSLGEPSVFPSNGAQLLGFLIRRDYEKLNDPPLTARCRRIRTFMAVYILFFAAIIVAFFSSSGSAKAS